MVLNEKTRSNIKKKSELINNMNSNLSKRVAPIKNPEAEKLINAIKLENLLRNSNKIIQNYNYNILGDGFNTKANSQDKVKINLEK